MIQEFKDFINRGNVVDAAVGLVLALAFIPVIGAVVERVLMPLIGMIFGSPNFDSIGQFACDVELTQAQIDAGVSGCAGSIGAVITQIISFILVGLALFFVVKAYNKMKGPEEEEDEGPSEVDLLTEIRDGLKR